MRRAFDATEKLSDNGTHHCDVPDRQTQYLDGAAATLRVFEGKADQTARGPYVDRRMVTAVVISSTLRAVSSTAVFVELSTPTKEDRRHF
jgi:hypothetical protein